MKRVLVSNAIAAAGRVIATAGMSQSSLKRVLVSNVKAGEYSLTWDVAILFEASPGFQHTAQRTFIMMTDVVAILFEASPCFQQSCQLNTPPRREMKVAILFEASPGFQQEVEQNILLGADPEWGRNPL